MNLGTIRLRVLKRVPGLDPVLLDGFILDRYQAVLDRVNWRRQRVTATIQTVAPYATGTLSLTAGSDAVTLAGGAFTEDFDGRQLVLPDRDETYIFTYVGAAAGTLDRPFEGETETTGFQLAQSIYALPSDARIVQRARLLSQPRDLARRDPGALPNVFGTPQVWMLAADEASDPPVMRMRIHPIPDQVYSLDVDYDREAPAVAGSSASLLPWIRPAAVIAGATADALAAKAPPDYAGSDREGAKYEKYLADMVRTEALNRGAVPLRVASWISRPNLLRTIRNASPRSGPRLP